MAGGPGAAGWLLASIPFIASGWLALHGPVWPLVGYAIASLWAAGLHVADKQRARGGRWRIPESQLHLAELLGGWPGALLARHLLHHKTCKRGYRMVFGAIVALHLLVWGVLATGGHPPGGFLFSVSE